MQIYWKKKNVKKVEKSRKFMYFEKEEDFCDGLDSRDKSNMKKPQTRGQTDANNYRLQTI